MSTLVNPPHHYYSPEHLVHVIAEMRRLGAPLIRAYFDGEIWHAREGTHRLRASKLLGIAPRLLHVPWPRTRAALLRARFSAMRQGHLFEHVDVVTL